MSVSIRRRLRLSSPTRYVLWTIGAAVVIGAALLYWRTAIPRVERFDWRRNYLETSTQPFGAGALFRFLKDYFPQHSLILVNDELNKKLPLSSEQAATYFFIGHRPFYDSAATAHLLAFVEQGNTAFLCCEQLPFDLMFHLYYRECPDAPWSSLTDLWLDSLSLSLTHFDLDTPIAVYLSYRNEVRPSSGWKVFPKEIFCPPQLPHTPLGYAHRSEINFACFPYGEGFFFLHTTPLVFTNYHLLRPEIQRYAEAVLSYLPEGDIYWDALYREPGSERPENRHARQVADHTLRYIAQKPPLAWAWYLTMAMALLYVLFRCKRRQRIIPIRLQKENTALEYIQTIALLHFKKKNYRYLCVQEMRAFLSQVQERYGIRIPVEEANSSGQVSEEALKRLSDVSGVPIGDIRAIFTNYRAALLYEPDAETLSIVTAHISRFWGRAAGGVLTHGSQSATSLSR